jgi:hypothetical protein
VAKVVVEQKSNCCKKQEWIPTERVPVMPTQFQARNCSCEVMLLRFLIETYANVWAVADKPQKKPQASYSDGWVWLILL